MKKKFRYIILIVYLVIIFVLIFLVIKNNFLYKKIPVTPVLENNKITTQEKNKVAAEEQVKENKKDKANNEISSTIVVGELKLQTNFEVGKSLYDVLVMEKNNGRLNLVGKDFSGLGFFVSSIGALKETSDKHLIYFVNGKSPSVGISNYILKDKDVIEWQLK